MLGSVDEVAQSRAERESVAGRRLVRSTDGGRIRSRRTKRGPTTAQGRIRSRTDGREPKVVSSSVGDDPGRRDREVRAVRDRTWAGPDALFRLREADVREVTIPPAERIRFLAEGARGLWNRGASWRRRLEIKAARVEEVVDCSPAVEQLGTIAGSQRRWSGPAPQVGIRRPRRPRLKGRVRAVVAAHKGLGGRRADAVLRRERNDFERKAETGRMDDARIAGLKLPIGSGAIDSAIRRVVNLGLKGASISWHQPRAEAVLL